MALIEPAQFQSISAHIARVVRAHRRARGWSLGELARRASLSKTSLSKIEAAAANPALETLWKIADALDLPLGSLLAEREPPPKKVVRAMEGQLVTSRSGLVGRLILAEGRAHRTEVFELALEDGVDYRSHAHASGTEELVICLDGGLRVGPIADEVELDPGDSLWFPADVDHRYQAENGAHGILVMSYPAAHSGSA